jgi:hypothetical protein
MSVSRARSTNGKCLFPAIGVRFGHRCPSKLDRGGKDYGQGTDIVQVLSMRLNHLKTRFMMPFPFQEQEPFFEGYNNPFYFFEDVTLWITYVNLEAVVYSIQECHNNTAFHLLHLPTASQRLQ